MYHATCAVPPSRVPGCKRTSACVRAHNLLYHFSQNINRMSPNHTEFFRQVYRPLIKVIASRVRVMRADGTGIKPDTSECQKRRTATTSASRPAQHAITNPSWHSTASHVCVCVCASVTERSCRPTSEHRFEGPRKIVLSVIAKTNALYHYYFALNELRARRARPSGRSVASFSLNYGVSFHALKMMMTVDKMCDLPTCRAHTSNSNAERVRVRTLWIFPAWYLAATEHAN